MRRKSNSLASACVLATVLMVAGLSERAAQADDVKDVREQIKRLEDEKANLAARLAEVEALLGKLKDKKDAPVVRLELVRSFKMDWGDHLSVALSPDGKRILTGRGDSYGGGSEIGVWDADTGERLLSIDPKRSLGNVALSPDGKHIASGERDRNRVAEPSVPFVVLRDARTGKPTLTFKEASIAVRSVDFSADGKRILGAGGDDLNNGEIKVWDAGTGKLIRQIEGMRHSIVMQARLNRDGTRVVARWMHNDRVTVHDVDSGKELLMHKYDSRGVAISPDGRHIATGQFHSSIEGVRLWDVATGKEVYKLGNRSCNDVTFSPDGKWVAAVTQNRMQIWDAATGRELLSQEVSKAERLAFSADGRRLVCAAFRDLIVWNVKTQR